MRFLFITKHNPFGVGGGNFATYSYLKLFSELKDSSLDLCCVKECYNREKAATLKLNNIFLVPERNICVKIYESLVLSVFHRFRKYVNRISFSDYDYIIFDKSTIAGTFVKKAHKENKNIITIHHNFEKEYFLSTAGLVSKLLFIRGVIKNEKKAYQLSKYNFFLTMSDKQKFEKIYGSREKNIVTSIFFPDEINFLDNKTIKEYDYCITCSLNAPQNITTLYSFFGKYGKIFSTKKVVVAGRNPDIELVKFLKKYNIVVIPNPISTDEIIAKSRVYICPIEIGGGIKIRCLDALKGRLPVILHENSIRGYEVFEKNELFYTYSTYKDLVKVITQLDSNLLYEDYLDKYKKIVIDNFSLNSKIELLQEIL